MLIGSRPLNKTVADGLIGAMAMGNRRLKQGLPTLMCLLKQGTQMSETLVPDIWLMLSSQVQHI